MSFVDNSSPLPEHSRPSSSAKAPNEKLTENLNHEDDQQVRDTFLQHLPVKPYYSQRYGRKSNTNYTSSFGSVMDRTPSSLLELKQQRLIAAADRKKRIIARIVSVVGLLIIILCAAIVTLTLKMAPKIDELVRSKAGAHHFVPIISRITSTTTASTSPLIPASSLAKTKIGSPTTYPTNQTVSSSFQKRLSLRLRRR